MEKQKGICQECNKEYEYEYNPKYPRKYCPACSDKKQKEWHNMAKPEVVRPANMDVGYGKMNVGFDAIANMTVGELVRLIKQY